MGALKPEVDEGLPAAPSASAAVDADDGGLARDVVHVIQSAYHYLDADNRPRTDEQILEEDGWFADPESAALRCGQLNAKNRALYDVAMSRAKRERDVKIQAAETANREAAVLRANGMHKTDVKVPPPFEPVPFEEYRPDHGHTTYEVVEIRRSDHDGIARARRTSTGDVHAL